MTMPSQVVHITSDHAGYRLKEYIIEHMKAAGIAHMDYGPESEQEKEDYPDYAIKVIKAMHKDVNSRGILVCSSGIGMSIIANRFKFIRAALIFNRHMAFLSREHNNANVLCLGQAIIAPEEAWASVKTWLETGFGAGNHERRLEKINQYCVDDSCE